MPGGIKGVALGAVLVGMAWPVDAAPADVRWASPAGTGTACTHASPCKLRVAVGGRGVRAGDEVRVMRGTHNVGATQLLIDRAIRVNGVAGSPMPRVTSTGPTTVYVTNPSAIVSHLEIVNTAASSDAVWMAAGSLNRTFAHSRRAGCTLSPYPESARPLIRNSFCWGPLAGNGYGVLWAIGGPAPMSFTARLRNVTAVGALYGVYVGAGSGPTTLNLDAVNVIAQGISYEDVFGTANGAGSSVRAIFRYSNYDTRLAEPHDGATVAVTGPGVGTNQTGVPVFRDAASGDFHQRRSSPTVDAGTDTALNGVLDIDGQDRWMGSAPDIGGDEIPPAP